MSFFEFPQLCVRDDIAVMLSVAKHLFPMVCIEILRFAQNDRFADCVVMLSVAKHLFPIVFFLRSFAVLRMTGSRTVSYRTNVRYFFFRFLRLFAD